MLLFLLLHLCNIESIHNINDDDDERKTKKIYRDKFILYTLVQMNYSLYILFNFKYKDNLYRKI